MLGAAIAVTVFHVASANWHTAFANSSRARMRRARSSRGQVVRRVLGRRELPIPHAHAAVLEDPLREHVRHWLGRRRGRQGLDFDIRVVDARR